MSVKGTLGPDHIPVNKYSLLVVGVPEITVLSVSGIEEEIDTVDLPDRTKASGGQTQAIEFEITTPTHHTTEQAAMEAWFQESQDPVLPTYKKVGTLVMTSLSGEIVRSHSLVGLWPMKRALPELDLSNEGELAITTWTLCADDILPI